jgi:SRSO17 transposase
LLHPIQPSTLPLTSARKQRLGEYAHQYLSVFNRAAQFQSFQCYLQGLLDGERIKNVEAIAARVSHLESRKAFSQSLQHFISSSPWDFETILQCYRKKVFSQIDDPDSIWVVHDTVLPKKGNRSIGVHRQLARPLGRKMNCQVAVVVSQIGPRGFLPLAIRLYLPSKWIQDHQQAIESSVPETHREYQSKAQLAVNLIDRLRDEGWGDKPITGDEGYSTNTTFRDELSSRNLRCLDDLDSSLTLNPFISPAPSLRTEHPIESPLASGTITSVLPSSSGNLYLQDAIRQFEWLKTELGMDQFEGRSWLGWYHHVSMIFVAFGFLAQEFFRNND